METFVYTSYRNDRGTLATLAKTICDKLHEVPNSSCSASFCIILACYSFFSISISSASLLCLLSSHKDVLCRFIAKEALLWHQTHFPRELSKVYERSLSSGRIRGKTSLLPKCPNSMTTQLGGTSRSFQMRIHSNLVEMPLPRLIISNFVLWGLPALQHKHVRLKSTPHHHSSAKDLICQDTSFQRCLRQHPLIN